MQVSVQIDIASNRSTAYEHYDMIKEAVEFAAVGLYAKHGVRIKNIQAINNKVIMDLSIPDHHTNFSIGNHMRGVAAYLMRKYHETFSPLVLGKRLLLYTIIPQPVLEDDTISAAERLSAISAFAQLLNCNDNKSLDKVFKILKILNEED